MEREAFLSKVAASLGKTHSSEAGREGVRKPHPNPLLGKEREPEGVPATERSMLVERFVKELEAVGGRVVQVSTVAEAGKTLREMVDGKSPVLTWAREEFGTHPASFLATPPETGGEGVPCFADGWNIDWLWDEMDASTSEADYRTTLEAAVGVTTVDSAVAVTGTLVLSASATRPRSVSLVVDSHVALVREEQVVDNLGEALAKYSGSPIPPAVYCITGPSRSADIENDLTIGVHGPSSVTVILVAEF